MTYPEASPRGWLPPEPKEGRRGSSKNCSPSVEEEACTAGKDPERTTSLPVGSQGALRTAAVEEPGRTGQEGEVETLA